MYFALMSHWTNGVDTFNVKIHAVVLSPTCFSIPAFLLLKQSYFPWFVLAGQHQELFLELILGEKKNLVGM